MCVAVLKPRGVEMPSKQIMENCWANNPDGAGFAFNNGEKVYAYKGFMTFDDFYNKLMEVSNNINLKEQDVLLHFRIATHGGVNKECTHPFPVTKNIEEMKFLSYTCPVVFAHNGILSGYGNTKNNISDTMEYNQKVIANIKHLKEQDKLIDVLAYENSSRFVLLFKDYYILGGAWIEEDGVAYSNSTYKATRAIYTNYGSYFSDCWFDSRTSGTCDYCGEKGRLYTNNLVWICKDCMKAEKKYSRYYSK